MKLDNYVFTSESVSEGHPDKMCDQISDGILDALLDQDPASRVACETLAKNDLIVLAGEVTTKAQVDFDKVVRSVIDQIGYNDASLGFTAKSCEIKQYINEQSPDICQGVTEGQGAFTEQGAGDQGLMFGFACNETEELMPLPIMLSHNLVSELARVRKSGEVDFLRPDSKSQVSVIYADGRPLAVDTIVISTQHATNAAASDIENLIKDKVVPAIVPSKFLTKNTRYLINPTGRFVVGGPVGDAGLTGRKIIVDTYGGYSRHGGGAFSGKDPSKVDRSAAYMARYMAKNIVAAGLADKCEVQLAYAIGVAEPVSVYVDTFGTGKLEDLKIAQACRDIFRLTPRGIIESLQLMRPIYQSTAAYGHFGRKPTTAGHFSWERCDQVEELKKIG